MNVSTDTAERERIAIEAVELARNPGRPRALQVIAEAFTEWTELRGDRLFGDDRAVVGGPALLGSRWVMVIGQEKGTDALSRALHNFGMPHPEGYRKAQRLMRTAEKFGLPVVCLVDTPAAHAGIGAEERGQAWAIAQSLITMLELRVPVVSAVLSEGGSGGALALASPTACWRWRTPCTRSPRRRPAPPSSTATPGRGLARRQRCAPGSPPPMTSGSSTSSSPNRCPARMPTRP